MGNLWNYFPKGRRLPALERNILKYRAYEMIVMLYLIEDLREYVLRMIRANDATRIPQGTKKPYERAWAYLVEKGVITQDESDDIRKLTDFRNTIAHAIQKLTFDLSQDSFVVDWGSQAVKYDYKGLKKAKKLRAKIGKGLRDLIYVVTLDELMFEAAEKTFEEELTRLRKRSTNSSQSDRRK